MAKPSFIHKKGEYIERVAKSSTDIRLLAKERSMEIMKQKIAENSSFYLDSSREWQGFEFIYILEGCLEYKGEDSSFRLEPGDYIARREAPDRAWFRTKSDVTVIYASTQPAFYLLREEIQDYLELAGKVESKEHMEGHSKRLVKMSNEVGKRFELSEERLFNIRYAAFFHDIGKAKIPERILEKQSELTEEEWEVMEKHPIWGEEKLQEKEDLARAGKIVGQSHERVDGTGYPRGLDGEEICLEAKIVSVVDAWDAMRTDRPYRDALSEQEALRELEDNAGTQFDSEVVRTFIDVYKQKKDIRTETRSRGEYKDIEDQRRKMNELFELGGKIRSANEIEEILSMTAKAVVEASAFRKAVVSLFDRPIDPGSPGPAKITKFKCFGYTDQEIECFYEAGEGKRRMDPEKFDREFLLSRSYFIPHGDETRYPSEEVALRSRLSGEETIDWYSKDSLYTPLYIDGEIIGQIYVEDPDNDLFQMEEDLGPIEGLADLAALGIENLRRKEEPSKGPEKLEER